MIKKPLKIGIIGAGGIMRGVHMPGWKAAEDCEVVAVCDTNREVMERFAADFGIKQTCTDFTELVQLPELDIIDIATPNRFHTPAVLAALEAGKHVLCEKPLAVTTAEVREMGEAARKAGRLLMTAQHHRYGAPAVALKRWVDSGALGEVYYARVHATRRNWLPTPPTFIAEELAGGGPCMDIGVHALDTALWLMGFPNPVRVTGTCLTNFAKGDTIPGAWGEWDRKKFTVEDFASGFVHFSNGATMVIECSWLQHQHEDEDFSARLFGKKASVQWPAGDFSSTINRTLLDGTIKPVGGLRPPHSEEIAAFADAVRHNKPSPIPVAETLKVIAILEGIYESARTGREVLLRGDDLQVPVKKTKK